MTRGFDGKPYWQNFSFREPGDDKTNDRGLVRGCAADGRPDSSSGDTA